MLISLYSRTAALLAFVLVRHARKRASQQRLSQATEMTDSLPTITDVQLLELIGRGNFSEVYRGLWMGTTVVAVKKLRSEAQLAQFAAEATVLKSLNHPNIVRTPLRCLTLHSDTLSRFPFWACSSRRGARGVSSWSTWTRARCLRFSEGKKRPYLPRD